METDKPTNISLTGENSHTIEIPLGQGSFSIGAIGMDSKNHDVLVDSDLPINWDSFNTCFTPHGKMNSDRYPFGDWPRNFHYAGNDSSFSKWSEKREIEQFNWSPMKSVSADFTKSNIGGFVIEAYDHKIDLKLGTHSGFAISGKIEHVTIQSVVKVNAVSFHPSVTKNAESSYQLPVIKAFSDITNVSVSVEPIGEAFDCKSLLQFENLTSLKLHGNVINLQCLAQFVNLERLALRYVPSLENLPSLNTWDNLDSFIGWNIEESKGKLIRKELKSLAKDRELDYSTVSQLRKSIWFTTEYEMPFSAWEGKNAKAAVKHYKATLKKLKKVKTEEEAKEVLTGFIKVFNDLPKIETSEREDIGDAVFQLRQIPSFEIDADTANQWFDDVRDY